MGGKGDKENERERERERERKRERGSNGFCSDLGTNSSDMVLSMLLCVYSVLTYMPFVCVCMCVIARVCNVCVFFNLLHVCGGKFWKGLLADEQVVCGLNNLENSYEERQRERETKRGSVRE